MDRYLATIDIGTNSVHMAIMRLDATGHYEILTREKEAVRLGSGSHDLDLIKPEAMERALHALERFCRIARDYEAEIRAVATSAVREATNQADFLRELEKRCQIHCEVVSGTEEARLIYLGILMGMPLFERRILAIDIGGGSTEFTVGERGLTLFSVSLKLGAIRLTDRFFSREPISKENVKQCRSFIRTALSGLQQEVRSHGFEVAVGSSGTIETLAAMSNRATELPESLTAARLNQITEQILSIRQASERARLPGLDGKRADIIVGGAVLLSEIMNTLQIKELRISRYALREGILFDSLERLGLRKHTADIRLSSVRNLCGRLTLPGLPGLDALEHAAGLARQIARQLLEAQRITINKDQIFLLHAATLLCNIGLIVAHSGHHKHSYYIVKNSDQILGFQNQEIHTIALLTRYHRKAFPSLKHPEFALLPTKEQDQVRQMAGILRIALALNRSGKNSIQEVRLKSSKEGIHLGLLPSEQATEDSLQLDREAAEIKSDLLAETLRIPVAFAIMAHSG
ncbi:MAG: Ppx/GppA family phosphatase [Spirochaetales bacterium]|nr:Ppx/GppA family phosphatase [Spirochaetales bacterium]